MGFLDSLGDTLKSLGGAVGAPYGLVYDLATMAFDEKDDDLGSVLAAAGHRGGDILDPFTNSSTWTGFGVGKTMEALTWAYEEAVDQPLGAFVTEMQHATTEQGIGNKFKSIFSAEDWAKAYEISDKQTLGQAAVFGFSNLDNTDPFAASPDSTPFAESELAKDHPIFAQGTSLGVDLAFAWFLDPGVVAGKAAGAARMSSLGKLRNYDRLDFEKKLAGTAATTGIRPRDWSGRFDRYFDFVAGNNHLLRPLNAAEIHAASPELIRSAQGKAIAGLMEDALKLPTELERRNTLRRVIAVGAGDVSQIGRIKEESASAASIVDALGNIGKSTTPHLHLQALKDEVRFEPEFNAEFARQLDNLNGEGAVDEFVKDWGSRVKARLDANTRMLDIQGDLNFVPGAHGVTGNRALRVQHGKTIGAKTADAHDAAIEGARRIAKRESYTGVFQKSIYHMPLIVAHPVGLLASIYTKAPRAAVSSLKQTHFNGVANLHDWNGSTAQLDSMMRVAGVDDTTRLKHLSDAYKAGSEADKLTSIHRVEAVATSALARQMSERVGREVNPEFIQQITIDRQVARNKSMARTDGGRIYGATTAPEEMASGLRARAAAKGDEAATDQAFDEGFTSLGPGEGQPWRIDQIPDESGLPMALPLTVAQLGNRVPLFDIHLAKKLTGDAAWTERFAKLSDAWTHEARELGALEAQLLRSGAGASSLLGKAVAGKRAGLEALTHAGSVMTRWWKYSVLFRLGYPMRVLMDDHMRIASTLHWSTFALGNAREGIGNGIRNNAPAMLHGNGRRGQARQAYTLARARRSELTTHFGRDAHTDEEWLELKGAIKGGDRETIARLDPDGRVSEHIETAREARSLAASVTGHKAAIARWKKQLSDADDKRTLGLDPGVDTADLHSKIQQAEAAIRDKEAGRAFLLEQLGDDPDALRDELVRLNHAIDRGAKGFAEPKRRLGENPVKLDDGVVAQGVYGTGGGTYRIEAGSQQNYTELLTDGEESSFNLISSGAHRTIRPSEPGHLTVWANVLNHQFHNSPELMAFVRGKVSTPEQFAKWLAEPEQAYIRNRMSHFAHDPEDWGSRLQELYHDYIPTAELRDALKDGQVSAGKLARMFPDEGMRPTVHGQLANVNTGRHTATRMTANAMNRMFRLLSEMPTDKLSRHPYMNAMYQQELRDLYNVKKAFYAREGKEFTQDDLYDLERQARIKALGHLKRTLWDVSAHSHGAHVMRFLSPFFAAHQEALTRWWRIATDDPSIVRKFQLAFDAPRKAGLTYDAQTGELVPEGEGPSPSHQIMLRIPFAGADAPVNKWLRKLGGGKHWRVNENGFNLILQNGIANPGTGPVVTVPMEALVNKYASEPEIEKAARILNPYPPDSPLAAMQPAWSKRALAVIQGPGNKEWGRRYNGNLSDAIVEWRLAHGEAIPTEAQMDALAQKAGDDTNRDMLLMMLSNMTSPLPAKPESKYAVVQHGITRIMSQMRSAGHDFEWAKDQVAAKYGEIYTALLYSQTNNKSRLSSTYAEVDAIQRHKGILGKTDPTLARMIVGPAAAMDAEADPGVGKYSAAARRFLMNEKVSPYSTETYMSSKEPDEAGVSTLIDAGWSQYEELTNWLQVQAEARGLSSYEDDKSLVEAKRAGMKYLLESNYAFAHEWNSFDRGAGYEEKLADMRQIASSRDLVNDPTRQDVYWLGQYIQLRDAITATLAQRKEAGGAGTVQAKANADLVKVFSLGVKYIRQQNTFFDTYHYHGLIERDPYLLGGDDE